MTSDAKARQEIDALLFASGWRVCNFVDITQICIVAEVDRHLFIVRKVESGVDASLKRAQTPTA